MFTSNAAEVLTFNKLEEKKLEKVETGNGLKDNLKNENEVPKLENKQIKMPDTFKKLLHLHKRLKEVALFESGKKPSKMLADLTQDEVDEIKKLEDKLGYTIVAYETEEVISENKLMILNRVDSLLDEYLTMVKPKEVETQTPSDDGLGKFFEQ